MSLSNCIRIPLSLPNVDIFTFGESSLYGYDSLNHCLIVLSLVELNSLNEKSINRLHLSSIPKYEIKKLILNQDETILALISDKTAYLIYLPKLNNSPSKGSRLCPLNEIHSLISDSLLINNILIDFIWLSSFHFIIVNSIPSSSECHLYIVRSSKHYKIEYIQTFSIGSTIKTKNIRTPNKKISLNHPPDIVKLDLGKRKENDLILILLFAMETNGDIFLMEIEENQLLNSEEELLCKFVGPIIILPEIFNNYGSNYSNSHLICLSYSEYPLIIFTNNKNEIYQSIILNTNIEEYYLFTIDKINLIKNENNQFIKLIIKDKLNSNIYYILDSLSNIYSIEINWINQIKQKQFDKTIIQHLIKSNYYIEQFNLIQTNNKGQWLTIITKINNQQKELILLRPHSLSLNSTINKSDCLIQLKQSNKLNSSSEFIHRIRQILQREQSLPHLIISSSSTTNIISNVDFQNNIFKFLEIFSEEYIQKQEKVKIELENKKRYLYDFQQTQFIAYQELYQKFQYIIQKFQLLNQQYQQEYSHRLEISSHTDDLLSIIEQNTPIISDAEKLMHQKLERYQCQIKSLREKIHLFKQFFSTKQNLTQNQQEQVDQNTIANIQPFVQYYKELIAQMKQKLNNSN